MSVSPSIWHQEMTEKQRRAKIKTVFAVKSTANHAVPYNESRPYVKLSIEFTGENNNLYVYHTSFVKIIWHIRLKFKLKVHPTSVNIMGFFALFCTPSAMRHGHLGIFTFMLPFQLFVECT